MLVGSARVADPVGPRVERRQYAFGVGAALGRVVGLRRYPVKSMLGEEVPAAELTATGLVGDRRYALLHRETGRVASGKHPRLWRDLLSCAAAYDGAAVRLTLPDGRTVSSADPDLDRVLSDLLGRPVRLTDTLPAAALLDRAVPEEVLRRGIDAAVPVTVSQVGGQDDADNFVDFAAVHLLSTSTLDRVAALSPRGTAEPERYRPNIVVQTEVAGFPENDWCGRAVRIGEQALLRVVARTPRCAVPTLAHGDLPRDAAALRVPAAHNRVSPLPEAEPQPCAGAYAEVGQPGLVAVGDTVRLAD